MSLCEEHGFRPRVVQEAPQWLTALRLVGAGFGVTIAPACVREICRTQRCLLAAAWREEKERHRTRLSSR